MKFRGALALAFAGACCLPSVGWSVESLRLTQAVNRSLASNPSLVASRSDLDAVTAQAKREGMSPQFVVTGELENFGGSGSVSGFKSSETTLRLGRVIELGGKQKARQALGAAQIAQQNNTVAMTRITVASMTTSRFIAVLAEQKRVEILEEKVKLAERVCREVAKWVAAARNPESDLRSAEITLADAKLAHKNAERKLEIARMTLASSWGATRVDFGDVIGDLQTLPPVESFEKLAERLPSTLTFQSADLSARTIVAKKQVAIASSKPDVDFSLGVRRLQEVNDQALVMSISIPLGSKPRANFAIAEANALLAAAESRHQTLASEMHQSLFNTFQELMQARQEYETLTDLMIPKAEQAWAVSKKGFQMGRFSFIALAQVQGTLFDLRQRSIDAAARYHTLLVEVERLTAVSPEN